MTPETHAIIGAGQAGAHAAMAMREAGFPGRILLIGAEDHPPYERPPLSKDVLTADIEPPASWFHPEGRYNERKIEFLPGATVTEIDRPAQRLTLADGRTFPYDRLLLATGARARQLRIPGAESALYLRTLDDARTIRERLPNTGPVVCIGAGVIGLELASSIRARGRPVTVIEGAPTVMARSLPPDFARWLEALHRTNGVDFRFNARLREITPEAVIGEDFTIPTREVIAGIGVERNTELARGLDCDNGILVDEHGRSSDPNIYAAGDVAAFWHPVLNRRLRLEAWRHAQNHGIATGRAMAQAARNEPAPAYDDVPWFWTDQHKTNIQVAGLPDTGTQTIMRGAFNDPSFAAFYLDPQGRVVGAIGVNAPREIRAALSLIRSGHPPDPAALADPAVPPQKLVAR